MAVQAVAAAAHENQNEWKRNPANLGANGVHAEWMQNWVPESSLEGEGVISPSPQEPRSHALREKSRDPCHMK